MRKYERVKWLIIALVLTFYFSTFLYEGYEYLVAYNNKKTYKMSIIDGLIPGIRFKNIAGDYYAYRNKLYLEDVLDFFTIEYNEIEGVDASSIRTIGDTSTPFSNYYIITKNKVLNSKGIIDEADPETFKLLDSKNDNFAVDANNLYYKTKVIQSGDVNKYFLISPKANYYADGQRIYHPDLNFNLTYPPEMARDLKTNDRFIFYVKNQAYMLNIDVRDLVDYALNQETLEKPELEVLFMDLRLGRLIFEYRGYVFMIEDLAVVPTTAELGDEITQNTPNNILVPSFRTSEYTYRYKVYGFNNVKKEDVFLDPSYKHEKLYLFTNKKNYKRFYLNSLDFSDQHNINIPKDFKVIVE